jgi:hypothetical protein
MIGACDVAWPRALRWQPYAARNGRHSPTRTRRSGWLSLEDYGDRRNTTRKVDCGFLELIAGIALAQFIPGVVGPQRPF